MTVSKRAGESRSESARAPDGVVLKSITGRAPFGMVYRDSMMSPEVRGLVPAARWVWVALLTFLAPGNTWNVSIVRLAEVTGYNRRTVRRALEDLVIAELLMKSYRNKEGRQLPNAWTLLLPRSLREQAYVGPPQSSP